MLTPDGNRRTEHEPQSQCYGYAPTSGVMQSLLQHFDTIGSTPESKLTAIADFS
jgi:hypothetical protein